MMHRVVALTAIGLASIVPVSSMTASAASIRTGCFAEVWYSDQTSGHTYEYLCGNLKLHAGQTVRVPVRTYLKTARIVRISHTRTYFGGPLKTVRAIVS